MITLKKAEAVAPFDISDIIESKGLDKDTLRLSIGSGDVKYSNCINLELEPHPDIDGDIYGDVKKGVPAPDETFAEVLMIHVIEHIEREYHPIVLREIWRILKPEGRLVLGFPDFIECAKRFIENKCGDRWTLYNNTIYGRQARNGDYHVTAMEQQDITDTLFSEGFVDVRYKATSIDVIVTARKGEKDGKCIRENSVIPENK